MSRAGAHRVPGYRAAGVPCGIKPGRALDLALIVSDRPAAAAGVFTRNRLPGAPVQVSRRHLRRGRAQAIVVNSGISNVATGARGLADAERMAERVSEAAGGVAARDVQVASTGVIGRYLPMSKIERGIAAAARALSPAGFDAAAHAILTTDTRPKLAFASGGGFSMLGIAKGSGMIMPDMATMLAYVATDAAAEPRLLREALREVVDSTFNRLSIDGETSPSDSVLVLANGACGRPPLAVGSRGSSALRSALADVSRELCEQLARDGEGVTRVADLVVAGARSDADAERLARRVASSVLVRTALFGADPNHGRIVQAAGAAGVALDPGRLSVKIGGVEVLRRGVPVGGNALGRAQRAMRRPRVEIALRVGRGPGRARILTTDLSYDYVRINAEYTT